MDTALEPATLDWWVTGDTYYDYTQVDFFGPRAPVLHDDFVGGTIPIGTVSFAAGQKRAYVTVLLAADAGAEHIELLQLNVTPGSSGLFNYRFSGAGSVVNDDTVPVLKVAPLAAAADEGDDGHTTVTFEVLRSANLVGPVTAVWAYDAISYSSIRTTNAADFAGGIFPSGVLTLEVNNRAQPSRFRSLPTTWPNRTRHSPSACRRRLPPELVHPYRQR